jgi:predicted HTH domain antitoxin
LEEVGRKKAKFCEVFAQLRAFPAAVSYTEIVKIWLDLPDAAVKQLAEEGADLSRAALEALAIDAYRMSRISGYQLCQLLDIPSRHDLDAFLKRHGVPLEYSLEDFDREAATSARLWQKRQAELSGDANRNRRTE